MKNIKLITTIVAYASLVGLAASAILFLTGKLPLDQTKQHILIATIVWFAASGYNMFHEKEHPKNENEYQ